MIDTIAIQIPLPDFEVTKPEKFSPSADAILRRKFYLGRKGFFSCIQNPLKKKKHSYPQLTLTVHRAKGGLRTTLGIEFSAPKLLLNNNLEELEETDLLPLLKALQERLKEMGVEVQIEVLMRARVRKVHFSKNILLRPYTTCSMIMDELEKAKLGNRLQCSKTDYLNGGRTLRFHNNSYEWVIYDKLAEMGMKSRQLNRSLPVGQHILRLEIRLNNTSQVRKLAENETRNLTLKSLFSSELSRALLIKQWQLAIKNLPLLAMSTNRPEDIFRCIQVQLPSMKQASHLQLLGLTLLEDSRGRNALPIIVDKKAVSRLQKLRRQSPNLGNKDFKHQEMQHITHELRNFSFFRLAAI